MDTDTSWKIENYICRCCHAEGYFFNLSEPRPFCGETEVYADMIRDLFDIDMKPVPGPASALTYTICMSCIFKLREAMQFKKQVQSCEDKFLDYYYTNKLEVVKKKDTMETVVKLEPVVEFKEEYLNEDELDSNDDTNPEFEIDNFDDDGSQSDEDLQFLSKKGKGKGKGKTEPVVPKPETKTVKAEQRTTSKNLVKVERIKLPVKKKDEKSMEEEQTTNFKLKEEDYVITGNLLKCARCNKSYVRRESLHNHVKNRHVEVPQYPCSVCARVFPSKSTITAHKYEAHGIDDRHKCNACNTAFNTRHALHKHNNNFHMLGGKRKCPSCEYETYSLQALYRHKVKHKTVKDFHCKFCRKSFLRKATLKIHERIHTNDRRKICNECGKAFVQKASLNYHMTRHHPDVQF